MPDFEDTNTNDDDNNSSATPSLENYQIQRERQNAHKYRKLYSALLEKHSGVVQQAWQGTTTSASSSSSTTTSESRLIQDMWESERNAIAVGLVCGCATLATIRFMTPVLLRRIGGKAKVEAVRKADEEAKRLGSYKYQRAFAWLVEGGFSFWVGNRAFHYSSKNSDGAYETLPKIPLCSGKSVIADNLCQEWVQITTQKIPRTFWKNLQTKNGLRDDRAWQAILNFSNNCVKRSAFERQMRIQATTATTAVTAQPPQSANGDDASNNISLSVGVPEDIVLSDLEAQKLVQDTPR